jgi:CHAD domain-containing protein
LAYTFKPNETVEKNVRHIAESQIEKAIAEIDDRDLAMHETVHRLRKRCKKLRGLVRLVRPCFDAYGRENALFRDTASRLSYIRDAEAILETYEDLIDSYADQIDTATFSTIRNRFAERKAEIAREEGLESKLACFRDAMTRAKKRIENWKIDEDGFDAVAGGLGKTYKRGRKAMAEAAEQSTAERLHEWRKRMKYHWYHARLLSELWPASMKPHISAAKELSDLLGTHHDLAVLKRTVVDEFGEIEDQRKVEAFIGLADGRQRSLEVQAFELGRKLLAEKKSALQKRWGAYWRAWQTEEDLRHSGLAA